MSSEVQETGGQRFMRGAKKFLGGLGKHMADDIATVGKQGLQWGLEALINLIGGKLMLRGKGAYEMAPNASAIGSNSLLRPELEGAAQATNTSNGGLRICHREFLGSVYGNYYWRPSTGSIGRTGVYVNVPDVNPAIKGIAVIGVNPPNFVTDDPNSQHPFNDPAACWYLNPGFATTFPWLSDVARNYQQFKVLGAVYEFASRASSVPFSQSGSAATGVVCITTQYNANDPPYLDRVSAENSMYTSSTVPSKSVLHPIECDPSLGSLQTRYIYRPNQSDPLSYNKFYNMCRTTVFTELIPGRNGGPSLAYAIPKEANSLLVTYPENQIIGDLWLMYDIVLEKVQTADVGGTPASSLEWLIPGTEAPIQAPILVSNALTRFNSAAAASNAVIPPPVGNIVILPSTDFARTALTKASVFDGNGLNLMVPQDNILVIPRGTLVGLSIDNGFMVSYECSGQCKIPGSSLGPPLLELSNAEPFNYYSEFDISGTGLIKGVSIVASNCKGNAAVGSTTNYFFNFVFKPISLNDDVIIEFKRGSYVDAGVATLCDFPVGTTAIPFIGNMSVELLDLTDVEPQGSSAVPGIGSQVGKVPRDLMLVEED